MKGSEDLEKDLLLNITGDTKKIIEEINGLQNTELTIKLDGDFGDLMKDIQSSAKKMSTSFSKAFDGINTSSIDKMNQALGKAESQSKSLGNSIKNSAKTINTDDIKNQIANNEKLLKSAKEVAEYDTNASKLILKRDLKSNGDISVKYQSLINEYKEAASSLNQAVKSGSLNKESKTYENKFSKLKEMQTAMLKLRSLYSGDTVLPDLPFKNGDNISKILGSSAEKYVANVATIEAKNKELAASINSTVSEASVQTQKLSIENLKIDPLKIEVDFSALDTLQSKISTINESIANMQPIKIQEQKVDGNKGTGKGTPSPKPKAPTKTKADMSYEDYLLQEAQNNSAIRIKQSKYEAEQKAKYEKEYTSWWTKQYTDVDKVYDQAISKEKEYYDLASKVDTDNASQTEQIKFNEVLNERKALLADINEYEKLGFSNAEKSKVLEAERIDSSKKYLQSIDNYVNGESSSSKATVTQISKLKDKTEKYSSSNYKVDTGNLIDTSKLGELEKARTVIDDIFGKLKSDNIGGKDNFNKMKQDAEEAIKLINEINSAENQRINKKGVLLEGFELGSTNDLAKLKQQMVEVAKATANGKVEILGFNNATKELSYSVTDNNKQITKMKLSTDEMNNGFRAQAGVVQEQGNLWSNALSGISKKFRSLAEYAISTVGVYQVWNVFKDGLGIVKNMDDAMTDLKKVTDETASTYDKFPKVASGVAKEIGSTATDIVNSTATWSRLGYNLKDATELAKNSAVYQNVGDIDIDTATNDLVSIMKAFDINPDNSLKVIDILNEVGNSFAVSSAGIGEFLQRSSSSMAAANNTLEETVAMGTAMNEVLQDTSTTGNTLKILGLRIRGASTEVEAMGESTDGMAESTSKLRDKIKALTNVDGTGGFDIMADADNFKSTYSIMQGISKIWDRMTDINRAGLLEMIAGKNRSQGVAALINNWSKAEDVLNTANNSDGSALAENEKQMDSLSGRITLLKGQLQELWTNTIDSDVAKGFVDFGTGILKVVDDVGLLKTALMGLSTVASLKGMG